MNDDRCLFRFRWSHKSTCSEWTLHSYASVPLVSFSLSLTHSFALSLCLLSPSLSLSLCIKGLSGFLFQAVWTAGAVRVPCQVHAAILQSHGHIPQFHVSHTTHSSLTHHLIVLIVSSLFSHLPLYLVAAFAKKIARLALSAPPQGGLICLQDSTSSAFVPRPHTQVSHKGLRVWE